MPASYLDGDYNVKSLGYRESASIIIQPPTASMAGKTVEVTVRWLGKGRVTITGSVAKNIKMSANSATFMFTPTGLAGARFNIVETDPADPIRSIDARETSLVMTGFWDQTFLNECRKFKSLRFMKWQVAVEDNTVIEWSKRNKATSQMGIAYDGVAIEHLVDLANKTKTDPWFCMPWNATDEYIRKFAEYVRDNLAPILTAYVETSNEVWNSVYKVNKQARDEGFARGFHPTDKNICMIKRYAERTVEVMNIWADVFVATPARIVRVAAFQNGSWPVEMAIGFRDTKDRVDAVATAPYFGVTLSLGGDVNSLLNTRLPDKMNAAFTAAKAVKAVAQKNGLRYVSYEGGQHVLSTDVDGQRRAQRDPRMGALYTTYLTRWRDEIGDQLTLFCDIAPINKYGAWGLQEYSGQLTDAPKYKAVNTFIVQYGARK